LRLGGAGALFLSVHRLRHPLADRLTTLHWLVVTLTALVLALVLASTTADPDLWGHLRFGLDVLALGELPSADPYSFTQDRPILYHEWLGAVVMALAYRAGGVAGLLVLKTAVLAAAFMLLWRAWRAAHPLAASAALLLAAWGALPLTRTIRPQLWTLLGLLLLISMLQRPLTPLRLIAVTGLFALWVNLHGGFIVGLGVLGVWCAIEVLVAWRTTGRLPWMYVAAPVAAVLATLVNPYGVELWRFLAETVRPSRDITEWQPLWTTPGYTWIPVLLTAAVLVAVGLWPSWPAVGVLALLWYGAVSVARLAPLAVPATILLMSATASPRWSTSTWTIRAPSPAAALVMVLPVLIGTWTAAQFISMPYRCLPLGEQDPAGMARLRATSGEGRIAVHFNWGQYALWHLAPRLRISWDGRRETLYSAQVQETQRAVLSGLPAGDRWLSEVKPEYVWLPASSVTRREWLLAHGYRVDHHDSVSFIAVRADLPPLPLAEPAGRCFPS
jgi:hypothetical protein